MGRANHGISAPVGAQDEEPRRDLSQAGSRRTAIDSRTSMLGLPSQSMAVGGVISPRTRAVCGDVAPVSLGQSQAVDGASILWADRLDECLRTARSLFEQSPHWLNFFREIFGPQGVIARLFPDPGSLAEFHRTAVCAEIQRMLEALRARRAPANHLDEPLRMITVRLPSSVYGFIQNQARAHGMSMNQYCIGQLLRVAEWAECQAAPKRRAGRRAKPK